MYYLLSNRLLNDPVENRQSPRNRVVAVVPERAGLNTLGSICAAFGVLR